MKISCDAQFKQYFYNYLAASDMLPDCIEVEYYERILKDYLLCHGVRIYVRDEREITRAHECRDFDELMLFYNKFGQI